MNSICSLLPVFSLSVHSISIISWGHQYHSPQRYCPKRKQCHLLQAIFNYPIACNASSKHSYWYYTIAFNTSSGNMFTFLSNHPISVDCKYIGQWTSNGGMCLHSSLQCTLIQRELASSSFRLNFSFRLRDKESLHKSACHSELTLTHGEESCDSSPSGNIAACFGRLRYSLQTWRKIR